MRTHALLLVLAVTISFTSAAATQRACNAEDLSFGAEFEFSGKGPLKIAHVNQAPASHYERIMSVISGYFGIVDPEFEHELTVVPHPSDPSQPARRLRKITWVDPQQRVWKIVPEYVNDFGVFDGYEVVTPPMKDVNELKAIVDALFASNLVEAGDRSAMHVHVNATCLSASALTNLITLHEMYEPVLRRLFGTSHFFGSENPFTKSLASVHPALLQALNQLAPESRTHAHLEQLFAERNEVELLHTASGNGLVDGEKLWKYHSLNLMHVLNINPSVEAKKGTVEFRAFDLMDGDSSAAAVEVCRALIEQASRMAANDVTIEYIPSEPLSSDASTLTGETSFDHLPKDVNEVRQIATTMLETLHVKSQLAFDRVASISAELPAKLESAVFADHRRAVSDCPNAGACANGGTCLPDGKGYTCVCVVGFTGASCESSFITPFCLSSPCSNGGACLQLNGTVSCECAHGFTGSLCESAINYCSSSPCSNGGLCSVSSTSDFDCNCPGGFTGRRCESTTTLCSSNPCENGGSCNDAGFFFTCSCVVGFTGVNCQSSADLCVSSPCNAGAVCLPSNQTGFSCVCPLGFTGANCESTINYCASSPCSNGGSCSVVNGIHFNCTCPAGFTGVFCGTEIDVCASTPCSNGGTCTALSFTSFTCTCSAGYTGAACETNTVCQSSPCSNGGTCSPLSLPGSAQFSCACTNGYTGYQCESVDNACASSPCANGGSCTSSPNAFSCACATNFTGIRCESPFNPCAIPGYCSPNATCENTAPGIGVCTCNSGLVGNGTLCSLNLTCAEQALSSNPCSNFSTCANSPQGFQCTCFPSYTGDGHTCVPLSIPQTAASFGNGGLPTQLFIDNLAPRFVNKTLNFTVTTTSTTAVLLTFTNAVNTDYLTISIHGGIVSATFNSGSGNGVVLGTGVIVNDGLPHFISFTYNAVQFSSTAILVVDQRTFTKHYSWKLFSIDTNNPIAMGLNFRGCVQSLHIAGKVVDFVNNTVTSSNFILGCGGAVGCATLPCLNGGTCVETNTTAAGFRCSCPTNFEGFNCASISTILFTVDGNGYGSFPTGLRTSTKSMVKFGFRAFAPNHTQLLFQQNSTALLGDWFEISLTAAGRLNVRYNLGSGIGANVSSSSYNDGSWYFLSLIRNNRTSSVRIDGIEVMTVTSPGSSRGLDVLTGPLLLGGQPSRPSVGLVGSLRDVIVDNALIDFTSATATLVNVRLNSTATVAGFTETNATSQYATFVPKIDSTVSFEIRTQTTSGQILYQGNPAQPDMIGVRVNNSNIVFTFNCGDAPAVMTSSVNVADGQWHNIVATRSGNVGALFVDGLVVVGHTGTQLQGIETTGALVLGNNRLGASFVGCIADVFLAGQSATDQLDLLSPVFTNTVLDSCTL